MRYASLLSTAMHLPERELTNEALRARIGQEAVEKLEAASGIKTRFCAPEDWATSDLALPAARKALARAGLSPADIDLLIVATDSPDHITPSTSVVLQHKLGAKNAGTFDVGCACASFPTAIGAAAGLIATNASIRRVLVAGVYLMRKLADPTDAMSFFYGDGSGAVILEAADRPGVLGVTMRADGSYAGRWSIPSGGTKEPATVESVAAGRTRVRLFEKYPPEVNEEGWPILVHRLAKEHGFSLSDVDLFLFTQVRKTTIENVMRRLELPMEKTHTVMEKWGYTGSACLPMALADALDHGRVHKDQLVVMVGSGVGYNQAAVALRI